jgi:hypothetical protein
MGLERITVALHMNPQLSDDNRNAAVGEQSSRPQIQRSHVRAVPYKSDYFQVHVNNAGSTSAFPAHWRLWLVLKELGARPRTA